jgi:hypothetical protein
VDLDAHCTAPKAALLKAQPAPNCELKTASLDPAQEQPADPPSANDADPDVALRAKLDYERQCYRHAELIARERLQNLQEAVQETVRALKRDGRVVSGPAD